VAIAITEANTALSVTARLGLTVRPDRIAYPLVLEVR
jgi:hypothetical protein